MVSSVSLLDFPFPSTDIIMLGEIFKITVLGQQIVFVGNVVS